MTLINYVTHVRLVDHTRLNVVHLLIPDVALSHNECAKKRGYTPGMVYGPERSITSIAIY